MHSKAPAVEPAKCAGSTDVVGKRFAAFLIDILVVNVAQVPLAIPIWLTSSSEAEMDGVSRVLALTFFALYFVVGESVWGRTLGKAALGLRVVTPEGERIELVQALVRNVARFVDLLFLGIPALVSMSGSPLKQRIGDKWANTVVIG